MRTLFTVTAAVVALYAGRADAQTRQQTGFMAQAGLGVGFLLMNQSTNGIQLNVSGVTGAGYVALGWNVVPSLAVHATFWNGVAFAPSATVRVGSASATAMSSSSTSLLQNAVGVGASYTLPALDLRFSGSVGLGLLSASTSRGSTTTSVSADPGFAFVLGASKHWALSRDWGIGVMANFVLQTNSETVAGVSYGITTLGAAVMFSAAYH
jgi:hypothetical protein